MDGTTKVIDINWRTDGIYELQLERKDMKFVPGDCVALYGKDGKVSRPYSFASSPHEEVLRFFIRRMEGGEVSPHLGALRVGDEVKLSPPFGWFRPGQAGDSAASVFIATGTGIAPFLSYLRTFPEKPPRRCLYGVRERGDALDVEWLRTHCDLSLAVSREAAPDAHHGRVTDLLDEVPLTADTHYYLCGLDAMIDQVTDWLEEKGIDITRIHRECFFNADSAE